jgi:hypothetical protein
MARNRISVAIERIVDGETPAAIGAARGGSRMGAHSSACGGCSISYEKFRSGFTFLDACYALRGSLDRDGKERRFFGVKTVTWWLWHQKQVLWAEHLRTCGFGVIDASDYRWQAARGRWYVVLDDDARYHLEAEAGAVLDVELDGDLYRGVLGEDHRLVVQAPWRELVLPCSWVRISNPRLIYSLSMSTSTAKS